MQIKWQWRHKMSKITKNGVSLKTLYVSNWNVVHLLYSSQSSTKPKKSVKQQTRHSSFWKGQVSFCVMVTGMLLWWQFFQYINPAKFQPCGLCTGMPYFVILHRFRVNLVTSLLWILWSPLICMKQNLEQLGNQECCYNKTNTILLHFEISSYYISVLCELRTYKWNEDVIITVVIAMITSSFHFFLLR